MEIFREDGHLTDEALAALAQGAALEELARLELAEHLAFCDRCLQRYTELLAAEPLLTPERSCRESLWARVRTRTLRLVTNRYATAAAAVALALTVVWGSRGVELPQRIVLPRPSISQELQTWSAKWNDSLDGAVSGLNDFLNGRGTSQPVQGGMDS